MNISLTIVSRSRQEAMRALPIVLLFGAMFYWLWRVRGRPLLTPPALPR